MRISRDKVNKLAHTVANALKELEQVEFIEDPTTYGQLRIATLKDPEGNLLQLLQPVGDGR